MFRSSAPKQPRNEDRPIPTGTAHPTFHLPPSPLLLKARLLSDFMPSQTPAGWHFHHPVFHMGKLRQGGVESVDQGYPKIEMMQPQPQIRPSPSNATLSTTAHITVLWGCLPSLLPPWSAHASIRHAAFHRPPYLFPKTTQTRVLQTHFTVGETEVW